MNELPAYILWEKMCILIDPPLKKVSSKFSYQAVFVNWMIVFLLIHFIAYILELVKWIF